MSGVAAVNLVHFVRYLRSLGLGVVPDTARELAEAIETVGLERRDDLHDALQSLTIVSPTEQEAFDEAFEIFFGAGSVVGGEQEDAEQTEEWSRASVPLIREALEPAADDADAPTTAGASHVERLATRDFAELEPGEREEVRRLIARMVWRPSDTVSRRWGPSRTGVRPDLRRSLRRAVRPEGDVMPLAMSDRRPRKRNVVVLADISGSMERYTEMFLYFMHAAQSRFGRMEAFVFATRLSRITREMRMRRPDQAMERIGAAVEDWSGGTRIGDAVLAFNRDWSRRVTRGGVIVLIISDGWDTGEPELLSREMDRLSRSVFRVVWLNPLAAREGFAPETRGMRAALPHVDHFLPAASVVDLRDVVRLLESVPAR
jgi:uncharacterized protein with von Willebrand factor type A (vWA) domain